MLPFTREQFLGCFAEYNLDVWPIQPLAYVLALVIVLMLLRPNRITQRAVAVGLALMWAWTGVVYHGLYFSVINKAAPAFAALFVLQAGLLLYLGAVRGRVAFGSPAGVSALAGWGLVLYAGLLYPLIAVWAGERYPWMPMFGITPCPLTLFTFGLLLLTTAPVPPWLLVIPFAWSLIGGSAAMLLDVPQDWLLLFSGVAIPLLIVRDRARHTPVRA